MRWWHVAIGCVVFIILGIAGLAGGAFYLFNQAKSSFLTEPAKIETLAQSILPGAKPLAGQTAKYGLDMMGLRGALFVPVGAKDDMKLDKGQLNVILVSVTEGDANRHVSLGGLSISTSHGRTDVSYGNGAGEELVKFESVDVQVGHKAFPGKLAVVKAEGQKKQRYTVSFRKPDKSNANVIVEGLADSFDQKAAQTFFDGIDPTGLEPLVPDASPTPVASETP